MITFLDSSTSTDPTPTEGRDLPSRRWLFVLDTEDSQAHVEIAMKIPGGLTWISIGSLSWIRPWIKIRVPPDSFRYQVTRRRGTGPVTVIAAPVET